MGSRVVVVGAGVALVASLPVRSGRRSVPTILEVADLDLRGWPADRRPERKRGGDHEAPCWTFERTSMGMFPCGREINLEAVQFCDQLLAHRRVDDAQPCRTRGARRARTGAPAAAILIEFLGDAKLTTPGAGCRSWPRSASQPGRPSPEECELSCRTPRGGMAFIRAFGASQLSLRANPAVVRARGMAECSSS
jgi:hypothetical protein